MARGAVWSFNTEATEIARRKKGLGIGDWALGPERRGMAMGGVWSFNAEAAEIARRKD